LGRGLRERGLRVTRSPDDGLRGSEFVRANKALIDRIGSVVYTRKGALSQSFRGLYARARGARVHARTRARRQDGRVGG